MKYAGPFLLNGGLVAFATWWISHRIGFAALGALFSVLSIGFVLNMGVAIFYFRREELLTGFFYLAAVLFIVYVFNSASSYHGKMVNG